MNTNKKLALRKQSIRALTADDLRIALGGLGRDGTGTGTGTGTCTHSHRTTKVPPPPPPPTKIY
jgi:hypothetical protein